MKIDVIQKNLEFFQCLSSKTRLEIIELLSCGSRNIGELAKQLGVSSTIVTRHIGMMEKAGIITAENIPGKRGLQKKCTLNVDKVLLNFIATHDVSTPRYNMMSIPVGHFQNYDIHPTCGLASIDQVIGIIDDPRYFSNPNKINANIIWFKSGWIEYIIPSYFFNHHNMKSLEIMLEICSEYPGYKEDHLSDIYFYLNDRCIGMWTSPGDFGSKKGTYTPQWWNLGTEYGLLKTIKVTDTGTYMDGTQLSNVTLSDIQIDYRKDLLFKMASPTETKNPGGLTLFGKGFGNYNQDINVRIEL